MRQAIWMLGGKKGFTTPASAQNYHHGAADSPDQPRIGKRSDFQLSVEATIMKLLLALCFLLSLNVPSFAQTYQTFQIARPVGVGAAGTGLHASNRTYRAYPGIPYKIHADAVGGRWPYTYSLSGAPAGMTIEAGPCTNIGPQGCTAGTITWPSPTAGTTNPITVTIHDADGRSVTGTWSITVSSTIGADGFCFLDATNGNDTTGTGALATPYRSIAKAYASCGARSILYFRGGATVYTIDSSILDGSTPGDCDLRVQWNELARGVIWLGYPGENPVIDFESTGNARPCFQMQGENIWIDGLTIRNVGSIGFKFNLRVGGYGAVVRNVNAQNLMFGVSGKNSSFFLWVRCDTCPTWFDTVQNSYFHNVASDGCALKLYGIQYGIFETSAYSRTINNEAILAIKGTVPRYTVRANTFASDVITGIGGNMDTASESTGGEVYHNLSQASGTNDIQGTITIGAKKINPIAPTWVYRNTFLGQVNVSNTISTDGPYYFINNVIVNSGGVSGGGSSGTCPQRLSCYYVTAYDRILTTNNLQGAPSDGLVDAYGQLQGSYRSSWIGLRGFELSATPGSGGTRPPTPQNIQVLPTP